MGTRNLICVYHDSKFKLTQYSQWDGYPGGQGATVLDFCRNLLPQNRAQFIEHLNSLFTPTQEQLDQWWKEAGKRDDGDWVTLEVANLFGKKHPSLSRDTGAEILRIILESNESVPVRPDLNFAADSLFCEWLYVVDLDKNVLEVYKGFNIEPLTESDRFFFLEEKCDGRKHSDSRRGEYSYHPVKLAASFPLDALPNEQEFCNVCNPPEPEEEATEAQPESTPAES